jgi:hypothetical protein
LDLAATADGTAFNFLVPLDLLKPGEKELFDSAEGLHFEVKRPNVFLELPIPESGKLLLLKGKIRGKDSRGRVAVQFRSVRRLFQSEEDVSEARRHQRWLELNWQVSQEPPFKEQIKSVKAASGFCGNFPDWLAAKMHAEVKRRLREEGYHVDDLLS